MLSLSHNTDGKNKSCKGDEYEKISVRSNQYAFVYYHKLQRELTVTIKSLFDQLEIPCEGNYIKNVLSVEEKSCQKFMGTHQHSVEKCCGGLTKQELMKKLKVVYERHTELMHLEMENWGL